jgi:O-methyltransferase
MNENIKKILPFTMTPIERCINLEKLIKSVNAENILGSLVECGVWKCGLLGLMKLSDKSYGGSREVVGFDSFRYVPPPDTKEDLSISLLQAKNNLKIMGAEDCILHEGYFHETFPRVRDSIKNISILRIDAGLYEVTKLCLEEFYSKVSIGGYVIIDDYGHYKECKKAVDEFRENNNIHSKIVHTDYTEIWWKK